MSPDDNAVPSTSSSSNSYIPPQELPVRTEPTKDEIKREIEEVIANHTLSMQSMVSTQFKLKNKDAKKCATKIIKKQTELNELLMELREKETHVPLPKPLPLPEVNKKNLTSSVVEVVQQGRGRAIRPIQQQVPVGLNSLPESVQKRIRSSMDKS